jgi:hypothetical protein
MYQIKCTSGYEIVVVGRGENGTCRVIQPSSGSYEAKFTGTYAQCLRWFADRSVKVTHK